jgi:hypothetical protein
MPSGVDAAQFARNYNLDAAELAATVERAELATVATGAQLTVVSREKAEALQRRRQAAPAPENPEHTRLWQLAEPVLLRAGRAGMTVPRLAEATRSKEAVLRDALHRRSASGDVVRVGEDRFYPRPVIGEFIAVAREVARSVPGGRFTAARFRDDAGVGRALAVQVLEALDRIGITRRVGDARVIVFPEGVKTP